MELLKYIQYTPMDWKHELGKFLFRRYLDFDAELVIIWEVTINQKHSISFSQYLAIKEHLFQGTKDALIEVIDVPIARNEQAFRRHYNQSPPYSKFSPGNE